MTLPGLRRSKYGEVAVRVDLEHAPILRRLPETQVWYPADDVAPTPLKMTTFGAAAPNVSATPGTTSAPARGLGRSTKASYVGS